MKRARSSQSSAKATLHTKEHYGELSDPQVFIILVHICRRHVILNVNGLNSLISFTDAK